MFIVINVVTPHIRRGVEVYVYELKTVTISSIRQKPYTIIIMDSIRNSGKMFLFRDTPSSKIKIRYRESVTYTVTVFKREIRFNFGRVIKYGTTGGGLIKFLLCSRDDCRINLRTYTTKYKLK